MVRTLSWHKGIRIQRLRLFFHTHTYRRRSRSPLFSLYCTSSVQCILCLPSPAGFGAESETFDPADDLFLLTPLHRKSRVLKCACSWKCANSMKHTQSVGQTAHNTYLVGWYVQKGWHWQKVNLSQGTKNERYKEKITKIRYSLVD